MKSHLVLGAALLALAASPALAQTSQSTTTVEQSDGPTTTTTKTIKRDPGGTAPGAVGGAVAGGAVAGPVGAVIGAIAGAAVGHSVAPPVEVRTYVTTQSTTSLAYGGDIAVGRRIDGGVAWIAVPDYPKYSWAYLNGRRVVIDNDTHVVAAVY